MKSFLSLLVVILTAFSNGFSQSIELNLTGGTITNLTALHGEDQYGNEFQFPQSDSEPMLIFFLPKTENRSEAEDYLDEIRNYVKKVRTDSVEHIEQLLVIEPYRSGSLVNRVFKSKMRKESFSVIRDPGSNIIGKVNHNNDKILLWLIDEKGQILYQSAKPFTEDDITLVNSHLQKHFNKIKQHLNEKN